MRTNQRHQYSIDFLVFNSYNTFNNAHKLTYMIQYAAIHALGTMQIGSTHACRTGKCFG